MTRFEDGVCRLRPFARKQVVFDMDDTTKYVRTVYECINDGNDEGFHKFMARINNNIHEVSYDHRGWWDTDDWFWGCEVEVVK